MSATPESPTSSCRAGRLLREFEEDLDLLRHEFDGWSIWPLFRVEVAAALGDPAAVPKAGNRRDEFSRREYLGLALRDLLTWIRPPGEVRGLFVSASSYRVASQGEPPRDTMFDELGLRLGGVLKLERLNHRALYELNPQSVLPSRMTDAWMLVANRIGARISPSAAARQTAESLHDAIRGTPIAGILNVDHMAQRIARFSRERRLWRRLCARIRPRVVVIDDSYHQHSLIAGAQEAGSWVIELQHGLFAPDGPEYGWSRDAVRHQRRMPLPDRLGVFGEYWKSLLLAEGFWGQRLAVVGSTRMERHLELPRPVRRLDQGIVLLVTTQGLAREALIGWLRETLMILSDQEALRVIVKLHPGYDPDPEPYRAAFSHDSRVVVQSGTGGIPTHERLLEADVHASISSTCHFDSLALGTPTIVLGLPSHDQVLGIVNGREARLATSPGQWAAAILEAARMRVPAEIRDHYFRRGSVETIAALVRDLESRPRESPAQPTRVPLEPPPLRR